jgi:hypothetical protein
VENRTLIPKTAQLRSEALDLRIAIDSELRRLGWHWKHPRIQAWLKRLSETNTSGRIVTMVCDMTDHDMQALLANLQAIPKQLEIGGEEDAS